jgi:phosphoribosylamine--glycine ligase
MRVLVIGSGAREHALAWKISQSPQVSAVYCAPGNPGCAQVARNVEVNPVDPPAVVKLAREHEIDLAVIGPEAPLVAGLADALRGAQIAACGPSAKAAAIEGSKAFAKEIMRAANVPTADARLFEDPIEAERYVQKVKRAVIKADGLAAGKGVIVANSAEEGVQAVRELSRLKDAGRRLLVEEFLEGEEVSIIALTDGERFVLLPPARDHKRLLDGDRGPNTGGMGAYCPALRDGSVLGRVGEQIIRPTLRELAHRNIPFNGALYAGLMLTSSGPKVLEFNCRFGDPEAQVLAMQVDEDLVPALLECASGRLERSKLQTRGDLAVGVVLAAAGYPNAPRKGDLISGELQPPQAYLFHAGTEILEGKLATAGGRVLTVCARGDSMAEAQRNAYAAVSKIHFEGMQYRRDIGARGLL